MTLSDELPPEPPPGADLDAVRVVFADDNDRFRAGMVRAFGRRPGLRLVAEASDGQEALALARAWRPDVLVLDDRMPGLTGLQVAAAMRRDRESTSTTVVMLTANDDQRFLAAAAAAGVVSVIDKADSRAAICGAVEAAGRRGGGPRAQPGAVSTRRTD